MKYSVTCNNVIIHCIKLAYRRHVYKPCRSKFFFNLKAIFINGLVSSFCSFDYLCHGLRSLYILLLCRRGDRLQTSEPDVYVIYRVNVVCLHDTSETGMKFNIPDTDGLKLFCGIRYIITKTVSVASYCCLTSCGRSVFCHMFNMVNTERPPHCEQNMLM